MFLRRISVFIDFLTTATPSPENSQSIIIPNIISAKYPQKTSNNKTE